MGDEKPPLRRVLHVGLSGKETDLSGIVDLSAGCFCRYMKKGKLDGVIFCHNYVADISLDTVEQVKDWIQLHGE